MFRPFKFWRKFSDQQDKYLNSYLKETLGFRPIDLKLYRLALTHRSVHSVDKNGVSLNNERLEFLGDAIIDALIADFLYRLYPEKKEGFLTTMRSKVVNRAFLENIAQQIELDRFLNSNLAEGSERNHLLGNAFEAFIGAIYIDQGYEKAKQFIEKMILSKFVDFEDLYNTESNPKSRLIEYCQKNKLNLQFNTIETQTHPNSFYCEISIDDEIIGTGNGLSKKVAEQCASIPALEKLKNSD